MSPDIEVDLSRWRQDVDDDGLSRAQRDAGIEYSRGLYDGVRNEDGVKEAVPTPQEVPEVPECTRTHMLGDDRRQCIACARRAAWVREQVETEKRAAGRSRSEPEIICLTDLLAEPEEDETYLVEDVWPESSHVLLSAPPKAGKTTMRNDLVRALADGVPFLGTFEVPCPVERVVVLDFELSRRMSREWLRREGIVRTGRVQVAPLRGQAHTLDLTDPDRRRWWIEALAGADVVILDCLEPVIGALGLDPNRDVRSGLLEPWTALMAEAGVDASLVIHHHGHGSDRPKGDSGIMAWADQLWTLTQQEAGAPRFLHVYGRGDEELPPSLVEQDASGRLRLTLGVNPRAAQARSEAATRGDHLLRVLLADHEKRVEGGEQAPADGLSVKWERQQTLIDLGRSHLGWGKDTTLAAAGDLEKTEPPLLVRSRAGKAGMAVYRLTPPALDRQGGSG